MHVFGYPCDMEALGAIAEKHGLAIIEDACEAVGSERRGRRVGGTGTPAVFAFYPNKQMTTGEGGMVTTDDAALAAQPALARQPGPLRLGRLARARPARLQLPHGRALGRRRRWRRSSASTRSWPRAPRSPRATTSCSRRIDGVTIPAPTAPGDVRSWFVYVVRLDAAIDRNAVMAALQARGVACKPYLPAVHLQPFYRSLGHRPGEFPIAEAVARSTLALPFHTRLAADDQAYVAACLADVLG